MNNSMYAGIVEATRLTREGRLAEATALILRNLGRAAVPSSTTNDLASASVPIEATFLVCEGPATVNSALVHGGSGTIAGPAATRQVAPPIVAESGAGVRHFWASRASAKPNLMFPDASSHLGVVPVRPDGKRVRRKVPQDAVVPADGRWLEGTHTNVAGTRAYKLYVPGKYRGQGLPLIVMLHGCTQDADDFAAGTGMNFLAEADGFLVVYPTQAAASNPSKCWNWFRDADQRRDQGEPALIAGITRRVMVEYHNDARRIYVAGLSAGGAMAAIMAATYPDLYAAVGVHSGLAPGSAHDLASALRAMQAGGHGRGAGAGHAIPLILFQGDSDSTVHPCNADDLIKQWVGVRPPSRSGGTAPSQLLLQGKSVGGRAYTRVNYQDARGQTVAEQWTVHGAGHAWSGGSNNGSYTDPDGPDASRELVRFFHEHPRGTSVPPL
jgi:poly(hydroxyalkanoate) depolymerase family esterase